MDRQNKQMNDWIRAASGHAPAATTEAQKPKPTANAGAGTGAPPPAVETPSQRINRFIRRLAGKAV